MNRAFLSISGLFLGMVLLSSCVESVEFHTTLEKVDQDSTNVIIDVSMRYTGPPSYHGVAGNIATFKFIDQKGKDYWLSGNCNCVGTGLERGKTKIIQYKMPKTDLPKGIYKVYLTARRQIKPEYRTIEIK